MQTDLEKARGYDAMFYYLKMFIASTIILLVVLAGLAHSADVGREYTKAVIHHSDSGCSTTVEDIDRWHKEKGWDGIGYHIVIACDGQVHAGRNYHIKGAHAKSGKPYSRNLWTGIVLIGRDTFTQAQITSLKRLLHGRGIEVVQRHHEQCPGPGIPEEIFTK